MLYWWMVSNDAKARVIIAGNSSHHSEWGTGQRTCLGQVQALLGQAPDNKRPGGGSG